MLLKSDMKLILLANLLKLLKLLGKMSYFFLSVDVQNFIGHAWTDFTTKTRRKKGKSRNKTKKKLGNGARQALSAHQYSIHRSANSVNYA